LQGSGIASQKSRGDGYTGFLGRAASRRTVATSALCEDLFTLGPCGVGPLWKRRQDVAPYEELKNLIVWVKDNGNGTFYRSRHELIFKKGTAPHINTFELGQHGRYRTNVWQYWGVNTLRSGRLDELALHPTVKPVQLIADAIKDVSRRNGAVLDLFGGSGSPLIAAHKTGRRAYLAELDPIYCDCIIRRWELYAKDDAELIACGVDSIIAPAGPSAL